MPASDLYALGATLIHLLTGTSPADLPQSNLRIQFRDKVSLNPSFLRWIESLTEPDLDRRFSSAAQALEALQTGASLPTIHQPAASRIRLKKSPSQLVIKIPRRRISLSKFLKFSLKVFLAVGSAIFLLLPNLIGLVISFEIINQVCVLKSLIGAALIIPIFLIALIVWSWRKTRKELASILGDLREATEYCFGLRSVFFYRHNFVIEPPLLFRFGEKRYREHRISDIENVEVARSEGVVIETVKHRYVLGQNLTESEHEWLVQEIQDWLAQR